MDDVIGVEKRDSYSDVVTDVDLNVVGNWPYGAFQEVSQAVIHQLHQEHRQVCVSVSEHAQVLDNVRVFYGTHELTLLLKAPNRQSVLSLR